MSAVMNNPRFADAEACLAREELQTERHGSIAGEVHAMTGARGTHHLIAGNVSMWLRQALRGGPCSVCINDFKLNASPEDDFLCPHVMLTCEPQDGPRGKDRFINDPWWVVEVLSASTASFDGGRKFELSCSIDTLTYSLLVEQDRPYAELFLPTGEAE